MKRTTAVLLCAALLLLPLFLSAGAAAEADKLAFVSINDTLPPELVNCASVYNGISYVPYYVFTNYGFGISYSYFVSAATAYLSTPDKQLFFELNSGDTYDGSDNHYSTPAILQNGTVYVPVGLVCRFFGGMNYSSIAGNEYGSILRITTDAVVLSDAEFLRAARTLMRTYYQNYQAGNSSPAAPAQSPAPVMHEGDRVMLGFAGLPDDGTLETLGAYELSACFFLTAQELRGSPDLVRRLSGEGFGLGIWCAGDSAQDWAEASELLFETARVRTILVSAPPEHIEDCLALAEREGLACWAPDHSLAAVGEEEAPAPDTVAAALDSVEGDASLLLSAAGNGTDLETLLESLLERRYDIVGPREIDTVRRSDT